MLPTFAVNDALGVARELTLRTSESLSKTAQTLYTALCGAALEVSRERHYSPNTTHITYFCPAESVALAVGIHPATLYRKLPELRQAGLVDARGHYCTHNGQTRSDGTLWSVRLTPNYGSAARVGYDYLKKSWRCLGDDIDAGRTAFAQMRESYSTRDKSEIRLDHITRWALSQPSKNPATNDSRKAQRFDLESIFDVPHVPKQDRAESVYNAALALAGSLNDKDSTRFYCAVLWGLLRLRDRGAGDYFGQLYDIAARCRADVQEAFANDGNGGKLFSARIKLTTWYTQAMAPPN
jgi:DNA-binding transcriptional ArsR family regulator